MAAVVTSPLVQPLTEAFAYWWNVDTSDDPRRLADIASDAVIAVVAALPADYTATDVLAYLRGEDVPSEPLPVHAEVWVDVPDDHPGYDAGVEVTA